MSDPPSVDGTIRARRACYFCRKRKIRCTREVPECSACRHHQQVCLYNGKSDYSMDRHTASNLSVLSDGNRLLQNPRERCVVASRFLDLEIFRQGQLNLPPTLRVPSPIPSYVTPFVGDNTFFQQVATRYYQLLHPWLPIISKRKVYNHLLNPLLPARIDATFLCLCMKLCTQQLEDENPWTPEYSAASQLFADLQIAGVLSTETLQGCILIAVYELGHSMYPAAQASLGISLKYALALGISWKSITEGTSGPLSWVEHEEQRRTWWAIFLIERIANLGSPHQQLLTPEPELTARLPCRDVDWDQKEHMEDFATLSTPPESLGRYANVVQASYLLSRVFLHVSDTSVHTELRQEEMIQLGRTLHALISYSESNVGTTYSIICYQTAISYCALLILYTPYLSHEQPVLRQQAVITFDHATEVALRVAEKYIMAERIDLTYGDIPPFVLPWMYMAGKHLINKGSLGDLGIIENTLQRLNAKWKSAGVYLELLAARRIMNSVPS